MFGLQSVNTAITQWTGFWGAILPQVYRRKTGCINHVNEHAHVFVVFKWLTPVPAATATRINYYLLILRLTCEQLVTVLVWNLLMLFNRNNHKLETRLFAAFLSHHWTVSSWSAVLPASSRWQQWSTFKPPPAAQHLLKHLELLLSPAAAADFTNADLMKRFLMDSS